MIGLQKEIIDKLQILKGLNMCKAYNFLNKNKLTNKEVGCVENIVAIILDRSLPKGDKGSDFIDFEVKSISANILKRSGELRTKGDTPISKFDPNDKDFFSSNIWDKTKSILIPIIHNNIIIDLRYFNATWNGYNDIMKNDYDRLLIGKPRKKESILVRKHFKAGDSIMIKGSLAIFLSKSIFNDMNNIIEDQESYIEYHFGDKIENYHKLLGPDDIIINNFKKLNDEERIKIMNILSIIHKEKELSEIDNTFPF